MRLRRMERDAGKRRQTAGDAGTLKRDAEQERLGAGRFGAGRGAGAPRGEAFRGTGAGRLEAGRGREGRGMRDAKDARLQAAS